METKEFVHNLFAEYEETAALRDFKEELLSNLDARIASLSTKGLDPQAAFEKATGELGDISTLADQISLRKKQEIIQDAYMGIRTCLKPGRVAMYVIAGAWAVLGIIIAMVVYFTREEQSALEAFWEPNKNMVGALGTLLAFIPPAIAAFTFLGITQETAWRYPLSKKRSAWYALTAAILSFGLILSPLTWLATDRGLMEAIATLIPFFIPGLALLIFILLTEKDTRKPWARERYEKEAKASMDLWKDPLAAARFGMVSGAIWISAVGFFILFGLLLGFRFSWLIFIFAVAIHLVVQSLMMKPNRNGKIQGE